MLESLVELNEPNAHRQSHEDDCNALDVSYNSTRRCVVLLPVTGEEHLAIPFALLQIKKCASGGNSDCAGNKFLRYHLTIQWKISDSKT